jgi:hypothetical protein
MYYVVSLKASILASILIIITLSLIITIYYNTRLKNYLSFSDNYPASRDHHSKT